MALINNCILHININLIVLITILAYSTGLVHKHCP